MKSSYSPGDNFDTPYQKAKQAWDKRLGDARVRSANWRLMCFLQASIMVLMAGGLIHLGSQSKVVPYIVEVGPLGDFKTKGFAQEQNYKPSLMLERYFVSNFVQSWRAISSDPVINKEKLTGIYAYLTQRSNGMLTAIHSKNDPLAESRIKTRTADIQTILPITDTSYQVDWMEIEYDKQGSRQKVEQYRGVFSLVRKPPSTDKEALANPLGLYVDNFSWQAR